MIRNILIVNDSHLERKILFSKLEYAYTVFEAEDSDVAYEILKNEDMDIIILDNLMQGETGYDIATKLRKNEKYDNVPLILMSSNESPIDEVRAFESGFNAYLHKNTMKDDIVPLIKSLENKQLSEPVNVLIVDDSRTTRTMLSSTFSKEGFTVEVAESGEQSIEILQKFKPDFITMDIKMDGIDGFQTSKIIRSNENTKDIPIIIITAVDTAETRLKSIEHGISEYYVKPFNPIKLIQYVKTVILELKRQKNQTVLIICKSLPTQHIISYTLNKKGYHTISINKTEEAMSIINQNKVDLMILDFEENKENINFKICKELKTAINKMNMSIPIIAILSIFDKNIIVEAFRNGIDDYITKPLIIQEIIERISTRLTAIKANKNLK